MKDIVDTRAVETAKAEVYTIGYEGTNIDAFLTKLVAEGVETLVDVRDLPLSRKKGFSKSKLQERVEAVGLNYLHIKALGDPREGRLAARAGEHERFVDIFCQHMRGDDARAALFDLAALARTTLTCLMCFERCHRGCHRSIVVEQLAEIVSIKVKHLEV